MATSETASPRVLILLRESHTPCPASVPHRPRRPKKPRESRKDKREHLARLATEPVPLLFQSNPFKANKSLFTPKSYTENVEAFCETARKRRSAIIRNLQMTGRRVSHMITINLCDEHHPAIINQHFRAFTKHIASRGLDGHWTIEINKNNLIHWHLLFLDFNGGADQLKKIVTRSLNEVSFPRFRVHSDRRRRTQRNLVDYCLKVKKPGYKLFEKEKDGLGVNTFSTSVPDIYEDKRVLFKKGTGLDKHGTFGSFWAEGWNEKKFRRQIQSEAIQIEKNLKDPRVRDLVVHMHKTLGVSLKTAKWVFALNPSTTESEALMRSLKAGKVPATQSRAPRKPPFPRAQAWSWITLRGRETHAVSQAVTGYRSFVNQPPCSVHRTGPAVVRHTQPNGTSTPDIRQYGLPTPPKTDLVVPLGCSP
jgi:hypothetical protein